MQLTLTRSGGFAGLMLPPIVVDSASVAPQVAQQWTSLLEAAHFFDLVTDARPPTQADRFRYNLTVAMDDGRTHSLDFSEENAPAPLLQLVQSLPKVRRP